MGLSPIIQVFFLRFSGFFSQKWASAILFEKKPETHQEKPPEFQGDKPIIQVTRDVLKFLRVRRTNDDKQIKHFF